MRVGLLEIVILLISVLFYILLFYFLNKHANDEQSFRMSARNRAFQLMITGNFIMLVTGAPLGIGWMIINVPFLLLLGYMAVLSYKSPLNGSAFALVFGIIIAGQRSVAYFGGGYPDIEPWVIAVFYLGAVMYMLPAATRLISTGVKTGWR